MKKKFKVTLIVFLVVVLGCFSQVFAATNQNAKTDKSIKTSKSVKLLDNSSVNDVYTDNLIPVMTSNTTPSGQVIYSSQYEPSGAAYNAFNGTTQGWTDRWLAGVSVKTGYIGYKFSKSQKIDKYTITPVVGDSQSGSVQCCKDWTFEASNDATNWSVLDTRSGVTDWTNGIKKEFTFENNNEYLYYRINVTAVNGGSALEIGDIGMMAVKNSDVIATGISLNGTTDSLTIGQTDTLTATVTPNDATNKNVTWKSSDPSIATVDSTGKVTAVKTGTATITATTTDGSNLSSSCAVTVNDPLILNIEPEKTKINLNDTVSANLTIDNIQDIAAEDIRIKYDSTKLQFLNYEEVDGIKLVENDVKDGELRFILASKGKTNIINAKKILLKLNFKGIAAGDALVDVTNGRVSDGITKEWDLTDEQCGQATITIQKLADVDNSGEYTLLDLGIDARHEGEDPSTLPQYNTDQDGNKAIDDADLTQIGKCILENSDYAPNNIK